MRRREDEKTSSVAFSSSVLTLLRLNVPPPPEIMSSSPAALILGPMQCGKSSLAFAVADMLALAAYQRHTTMIPPSASTATNTRVSSISTEAGSVTSDASECRGGDVWFICCRERMEKSLPLRVNFIDPPSNLAASSTSSSSPESNCLDWDAPHIDHIKLKYFTSTADLKWWTARLHQLVYSSPPSNTNTRDPALLPGAIIVDDLDMMLDAECRSNLPSPVSSEVVQRSMMRLMALLRNTVEFIASQCGRPCPLVVCFATSSRWYKDLLTIFQREFYQNLYEFRPVDLQHPSKRSRLNVASSSRSSVVLRNESSGIETLFTWKDRPECLEATKTF